MAIFLFYIDFLYNVSLLAIQYTLKYLALCLLFNIVVGSSFYDNILENYVGLKVRWTKLWRQRHKDLNLHFPAIKVGPFKKNNSVRKKKL